jgi:hypothetical protein
MLPPYLWRSCILPHKATTMQHNSASPCSLRLRRWWVAPTSGVRRWWWPLPPNRNCPPLPCSKLRFPDLTLRSAVNCCPILPVNRRPYALSHAREQPTTAAHRGARGVQRGAARPRHAAAGARDSGVHDRLRRRGRDPSPCSLGLSATSQQYFSLTTNQTAVLFSQNKPAPAISHQPTEQVACLSCDTRRGRGGATCRGGSLRPGLPLAQIRQRLKRTRDGGQRRGRGGEE